MTKFMVVLLGLVIALPTVASAQQIGSPMLARVHVITGNGTLPRNPKNRLEFLRYATTGEPRLTGKELIERIPEVAQFARVTVESEDFLAFDTPQDLKALSQRISARLQDPDIAGIVFTHGTNTIEETAYFLNLTVRSDKPVVIVGAQRPFSTMSSDAPLNLLNAIRVAAEPASRGKGTLVVLNDEINAARDVTKTNTYRVETFQAREVGILGYADPDRVVFYRAPTRRHTAQSQFDLTRIDEFPKVTILYGYSGDDGDLAKAAVAAGAEASSSPVPAPVIPRIAQGAQGALRQDRRRCGAQRARRRGPGNPRRQLAGAGLRSADNLNPQKARILLQLALTQTTKPDEIQRMFDEY